MNKSGLNTWNDEEVRELQLRLDAINKKMRRAKMKRLLLHPINALIGIYRTIIALFVKPKQIEYGWATSISNEKNGDGTITVEHYDMKGNTISAEIVLESELNNKEVVEEREKDWSLEEAAKYAATLNTPVIDQDKAARSLVLLMQEKGMVAKTPDAFDYQVGLLKSWDYITFHSYEKCIMAMQQPKQITSEPGFEFSAPLTKKNITEVMDELEKYADEVVKKTDKQKE